MKAEDKILKTLEVATVVVFVVAVLIVFWHWLVTC